MKKLLFTSILALAMAGTAVAASYTTVPVSGEITSSTTWSSDKQYLLKGYVYVTSGSTLTIQPGTIIRGDKDTKGALIIERGAKIMAQGTKDMPIIFTSNQAQGSRTYGDWGGVILCGKAPVNWTVGEAQVEGGPRSFYGGTDANDNSGVFQYVRIEFGGIAFSPNNEVNGLTLCGVGNGTTVDHIQVSYSGDDGYEWFGGTVNAKYLISHRSWDDDFDTDCGFRGMVQYGVILRDPYAADYSGSHGWESDSYQSGTASGLSGDTSKATEPVFSNVTAIGPVVNPTSTNFDPQFVSAAQPRRGSGISILNSVLAGWPCGIVIDESSSSYGSTVANIGNGMLQVRNNIIAGITSNSTPANKSVVFVFNGARSLTPTTANADTTASGTNWSTLAGYPGPFSWLYNTTNLNWQYAQVQNLQLGSPFDLQNPKFIPNSTSPIVYNGGKNWLGQTVSGLKAFDPTKPLNLDTTGNYANYNAPACVPNFTDSKAKNSFFDKVNYVGAFAGTSQSSDNWALGWANFDPNNTFYDYVVSVKDIKTNIESAKVFPNPATNNAVVNVTLTEASDLTISIVDMTGKKIKEVYTGANVIGAHSYNVDLTDLTTGLYLVSITSGTAHQSIKLSVIK